MDPATTTVIAAAVQRGEWKARDVVESTLERIAKLNPSLNAFTAITAERARARAEAIDSLPERTRLPLAGAPFAVKNLFDIEGLPTLAGSKINRTLSPARADACLIKRLEAAGAILVGALNMGEYAYDFTGENIHYGPSRNPHDLSRMSGGSSGGSGSAVAAGLVPLALGSDTNGSIRVPASLCGIFGLKPTYGRLPRTGTFPFVSSLDHVGPLTRSVADLAMSYDAMQGPDSDDPACNQRPSEPVASKLSLGIDGLKVAIAAGYFGKGLSSEAHDALLRVAKGLSAQDEIEIPEAERARSAAYVITAAEGAALHLERLRGQPEDFDPAVRDRLIAGAMIPAPLVEKAQIFRRWYRDRVLELFRTIDAIVAPATPCTAPEIGQQTFRLDGIEMPIRPNLGVYTQPISFIGLPVVVVPVALQPLAIGVQIIAAPWREDIVLRIAHFLAERRVAKCTPPI
jgi:1-carboxybiuret hydrolase